MLFLKKCSVFCFSLFSIYFFCSFSTNDEKLNRAIEIWQKHLKNYNIEFLGEFQNIYAFKIIEGDFFHAGIHSSATNIIYISENRIQKGPFSLLATVYHELGHAIFNLNHNSCVLMNERANTEFEYAQNWENWREEYIEIIKERRKATIASSKLNAHLLFQLNHKDTSPIK